MITPALKELQNGCSVTWRNIASCQASAQAEIARIAPSLKDTRLVPPDTALVVVGSLARLEWTADSDLDWMLLIDGQTDETHIAAAQEIRNTLHALGYKPPGPTGVFGGPTFSHELIHRIGGDSDSNQNTTRRVLLLLESTAIGEGDPVRNRVVTQLLKRYIVDDHGYRTQDERQPYVPGFLLNDFVRYWRTMAVDFAAKRREREGKGWALRRLKLRMSRKLIFAAGLVACLSCKLCPNAQLGGKFASEDDFCAAMTSFLLLASSKPPLEALAQASLTFKATKAAVDIFGAYDDFLGVLGDSERRKLLDDMHIDDVADSPLFKETNEIGIRFQRGLSTLFFETDADLTRCVQRFGVF